MRRTWPLLATAAALAACTDASERACRVGSDCASGVCLPDGTCAPPGFVRWLYK